MEEIKNISISTFSILVGIYIVIIGITYYIIFHKHHKRNKIGIDELVTLVTRFYTRTIILTILIFVGIYYIIIANQYKEDRNETISIILFGITIISIATINYIFYVKKSLKDPNPEIREATKKATIKIGEILEFIIFSIFILMPIFCIPYFINLVAKKDKLIKELIKIFALSFTSLFLLFALNPLDIKGKLNKRKELKEKSIKDKKDTK